MPVALGTPLALLTSSGLRLVRLVLRICRLFLSAAQGRMAPAFRSWAAWLWKLLSRCARHRGQSRSWLHASEGPGVGTMVDNNSAPGERINASQTQEHCSDCKHAHGTPPPRPPIDWQKTLERLQELSSNIQPNVPLPAIPENGSQRYKFNESRMAKLDTLDKFKLSVGQKKLLSSPPSLPDNSTWRRFVHPEGVALFYHEEFHIFTELDVSDPAKEKALFACAAGLVKRAIDPRPEGVSLDNFTHIVLNVDDDNKKWYYYFVDYTNRLLFWVDELDPSDLGIDLQKISGYNHIKYIVEANFWYAYLHAPFRCNDLFDMKLRTHTEYYPYIFLPKASFVDLRGIFNYAKIDMITTDSSSSPFAPDELQAMSGLFDSLKDAEAISDPHSIWAIARLMAYFIENQFLNFYGQPCARLNADDALFGKMNWYRLWWFRAINLFLLGSPKEHALRLQSIWVDGMIIQPRWKDFINRLTTELARFTIFSTVMLAVNFSFLAVPGVITVGSPAGPIQIIIYCSIISTIASIVFSFGLLNVYSNPRLLIARNALDAMSRLNETSGIPGLAITHSLPLASLIWSIALFAVALGVQIFGPKEHPTVSALSVEFFIIVLFVVTGLRVMWGFSGHDDVPDASTQDIKSRCYAIAQSLALGCIPCAFLQVPPPRDGSNAA